MGLSAPIKHLLGVGFENTGSKAHEGFMSFLEKFFLLNRNHNGLLLNGKNDRLSAKNSFTHALLVARTGGGKTSSFIIPNILDRDNASILVTDLSGELYKKTSGFMKNIGYNVLCLNLIDPSLSNTYNPLA
jgi:type IV secretory pathway TraG/TraD family ATPase VirD4